MRTEPPQTDDPLQPDGELLPAAEAYWSGSTGQVVARRLVGHVRSTQDCFVKVRQWFMHEWSPDAVAARTKRVSPPYPGLDGLSYRELQDRAQAAGLKANQKKNLLLQALSDHFLEKEFPEKTVPVSHPQFVMLRQCVEAMLIERGNWSMMNRSARRTHELRLM